VFFVCIVDFYKPYNPDELSVSIDHEAFPQNGVGQVLFHRHKLVNTIVTDIFHHRSLYFRGPKASGKSILLRLIGNKLSSELGMNVLIPSGKMTADYEVIRSISDEHFKATGKDTVVLIDEFPYFFKSNFHAIDFLLKSPARKLPHVRVVACGVHMLVDSPQDFSVKYNIKDMLLSHEDVDCEFVNYFISKLKDDGEKMTLHEKRNVVDTIFSLVLNFTGGHIYPFLKLCEHFITNFEVSKLNEEALQKFVASEEFKESNLYKSIFIRCFNSGDIANLAVSVYGNEDLILPSYDHVRHLRELGLWEDKKNFFVSDLFETVILNDYLKNSPETSLAGNSTDFEELKNMILTPEDYEPSKILEKAIVVGLSTMTEIDFVLPNGQDRLESAISHAVMKRLGQLKTLHIAPSFQVGNGWIDYFINGRINSYLEFIRNGDRIQEHVNRFKKGGRYESVGANGNYAILDIELKESTLKSIKIKEATPRFYTFLKMTNSLYLGPKLIKENVARIPSPNSSTKRSFATCRIDLGLKFLKISVKLSRLAIFILH